MMFLSPLRVFTVPILLLFTIPLALLACFTTGLAFATLIMQVGMVYVELALTYIFSFVPAWVPLIGHEVKFVQAHIGSGASSPRRHRRPSSGSICSIGGPITPGSEAGLGLTPSVGPERDYEGVGGWRVGEYNDAWSNINSRLEMADLRQWQHSGKGHHRAHTTEATTPGSDTGGLLMKTRNRSPEKRRSAVSPNSSRVRTSVTIPAPLTTLDGDGYFPAVSPKSVKRVTLCECTTE